MLDRACDALAGMRIRLALSAAFVFALTFCTLAVGVR